MELELAGAALQHTSGARAAAPVPEAHDAIKPVAKVRRGVSWPFTPS